MKRFASLAIALAALAQTASPAEAASTKYYARQKLANLSQTPTYVYTPAYGAFGACSGGTQSASITTCTRNDGVVVANSFCSPATKSQSCTNSCDALVHSPSGGIAGGTNRFGFTTYKGSDWSTKLAQLCEANMPGATYCFASSSDPASTADAARTWSVSVSNGSFNPSGSVMANYVASSCH